MRNLWRITGAAALAAAIVLAGRAYLSERSDWAHQQEHDALASEMLARLEVDHQARLPDTRAVIERLAAHAETENPSRESLLAQALLYQGGGDPEQARAVYEQLLEKAPEWSRAYYGYGVVLHKLDELDDAEAMFRRAIELAPRWSRAHNGLAILLRMQDRLEEARRHAETAVDLAPDSVASRNNYGNLLVRLEQYEAAEAEYRIAIDLQPDHPAPYYNFACVSSLQGKKDQALVYLEEAITREDAFREQAKVDGDFGPIRDSERFQALVYENAG